MQLIIQVHLQTNFINLYMLKYRSLLEQDDEDYTVKRNHHPIEIRKSNRENIFQKHRYLQHDQQENQIQQIDRNCPLKYNFCILIEDRIKGLYEFCHQKYQLEDLDKLIQELFDDDIKLKHHGAIGIRKILPEHSSIAIQHVVDAGLVEQLLELAQQTQWPQLQIQSSWSLTNIASGNSDHCSAIMEAGGIPIVVNLLRSPILYVAFEAVWCLGNLGSESVQYRDLIIQNGAINLAANIVTKELSEKQMSQCCWMLSNLCRGSPLPEYAKVEPAISAICQTLAIVSVPEDVFSDCLWAISYHSEGIKQRQGLIIRSNILPKIITILLTSKDKKMLVPSMRILGNISTGNENCTQQLMNVNVLSACHYNLFSPSFTIRRQCCWVLSNIAAGSWECNWQILKNQALMQKMIDMFLNEPRMDIRKQLCYVFSNMTYKNKGNFKLDQYFIQHRVLEGYMNILLQQDDPRVLQHVLETLYQICRDSDSIKGEERNCAVVRYIMRENKVELLENLQYCEEVVYLQANKILQAFFEMCDPLQKL